MGCHFLLQGIFPTQGSNLGLLHYRQPLYRLSHQGSQDISCHNSKTWPQGNRNKPILNSLPRPALPFLQNHNKDLCTCIPWLLPPPQPVMDRGAPHVALRGVRCLLLLGESEVALSYPTLCDPMDCRLPGSSVREICQARVLEWVAISFSRGFS